MRRRDRSRGAVLVEMALVAPIFFLLVFGVIEFGWAFVQYLDVRHGARETARLAAVNYSTGGSVGTTQTGIIIDEGCSRMDTVGDSDATLTLDVEDPGEIGDRVTVEVTTNLNTLTGFLDFALGGITLRSDVVIRLEDDASWDDFSKACP
jgi:Flp pilus assembly protein TadG